MSVVKHGLMKNANDVKMQEIERIRDKALHVLKNGGGNEMDEIFNQNERNTGKRDENIRSEIDKKERDEREKGYNTINLYPMGIVTASETESEMYM